MSTDKSPHINIHHPASQQKHKMDVSDSNTTQSTPIESNALPTQDGNAQRHNNNDNQVPLPEGWQNPVKKKMRVWNYFYQSINVQGNSARQYHAMCKHCKSVMAGRSEGMHTHLLTCIAMPSSENDTIQRIIREDSRPRSNTPVRPKTILPTHAAHGNVVTNTLDPTLIRYASQQQQNTDVSDLESMEEVDKIINSEKKSAAVGDEGRRDSFDGAIRQDKAKNTLELVQGNGATPQQQSRKRPAPSEIDKQIAKAKKAFREDNGQDDEGSEGSETVEDQAQHHEDTQTTGLDATRQSAAIESNVQDDNAQLEDIETDDRVKLPDTRDSSWTVSLPEGFIKPVNKRMPVWGYFYQSDGLRGNQASRRFHAMCKYCMTVAVGRSEVMHSHLLSCKEMPLSENDNIHNIIQAAKRVRPSLQAQSSTGNTVTFESTFDSKPAAAHGNAVNNALQGSSNTTESTGQRRQPLNRMLTIMCREALLSANISFTVLDDPCMRRFLSALDPDWTVPTSQTFSSSADEY